MFGITPSARLRPSPFFDATVKEGVTNFTTYNHMLMPTAFGNAEAEYWRLINGVSQWDVAVERQVQLKGPDAGRLAVILGHRRRRLRHFGCSRLRGLPSGRCDIGLLTYLHRVPLGHVIRAIVRQLSTERGKT